MKFEIEYLAEHVDAISTLARWHHDEWASTTPELTVADRAKRIRARARTGGVPTGFVAVVDHEVVGLACLVECDLESHAHLTPMVGDGARGAEPSRSRNWVNFMPLRHRRSASIRLRPCLPVHS